jgi:hypothetical protein
MQRVRHLRDHAEQTSLFQRPVDRPQWAQLPPPVRREVTDLLARLLRDEAAPDSVARVNAVAGVDVGGEEHDE